MAHYEKKYRLRDVTKVKDVLDRMIKDPNHDIELLYSTHETDHIFKEATPDQFRKLRHYNPAIRVKVNPETGEMWQGNPKNVGSNYGDMLLSHRVILESKGKDTRVSVFSSHHPQHFQNALDITLKNAPLDCVVIKPERHTYVMSYMDKTVLMHFDPTVTDKFGADIGGFIEFQVKDIDTETDNVVIQDITDWFETTFDLTHADTEPHTLRELIHMSLPIYETHFSTMPEEIMRAVNDCKTVNIPDGEVFIKENDISSFNGWLITEGSADVCYADGQFIRTLNAGDTVGEFHARKKETSGGQLLGRDADVISRGLVAKIIPETMILKFYENDGFNRYIDTRQHSDMHKNLVMRQSSHRM